jgi:hypothetical protein
MAVKLCLAGLVIAALTSCYYVRDDYYPRRRTVIERVERSAPADREDERSQEPAKKTEVVERVYVREYTPTVYYTHYDPWWYGYPHYHSSWHVGWGWGWHRHRHCHGWRTGVSFHFR